MHANYIRVPELNAKTLIKFVERHSVSLRQTVAVILARAVRSSRVPPTATVSSSSKHSVAGGEHGPQTTSVLWCPDGQPNCAEPPTPITGGR